MIALAIFIGSVIIGYCIIIAGEEIARVIHDLSKM
jgi:hypothetical protein